MSNSDCPDIGLWIKDGSPKLADLNKLAEYVQGEIAQRVSVTKMRKFYESVVKIRSFAANPDRARRLAYKMVVLLRYDMWREGDRCRKGLECLYKLVSSAVQAADEQKWSGSAVQNFLDLI